MLQPWAVGLKTQQRQRGRVMSKKHRLSLAEQIAQLADPRPSNFHPDEDEREQLGAVSLSYASEEDEGDHVQRSSLRVTSWEDDPRYTGRPVTRKELEQDDQEQEDYSADGSHWWL